MKTQTRGKAPAIIGRAAAAAIQHRQILAGNIARAERFHPDPIDDGSVQHERITRLADNDGNLVAGNASLLVEANFQQELTTFAVGFRDDAIDADIMAYCPQVPTARRFEYATFSSPEEFFGSATEDVRAIGSEFPKVEYTSAKVTAKTENRGLRIV